MLVFDIVVLVLVGGVLCMVILGDDYLLLVLVIGILGIFVM